ncbi:MAG TPA: hypothetical protein VFH73_25985 [Polyangia bacterium]|jgi:hypothetical protein|nr:hypothetical protein [Polyangia bacterium]
MLNKGARRPASSKRQGSAKLAISFEKGLAAKVRRAAGKRAAGNISAWLAEAAREQLRIEAGRSFLQEYESEHGTITKEELAEVGRRWPPD